jgi:IS66 C-terminal element
MLARIARIRPPRSDQNDIQLFRLCGAPHSHKNRLFAGRDKGRRTAAILYSKVGACKRLGIDPWTYLRDALTRLPELPADRLPDLLPDVWAQA